MDFTLSPPSLTQQVEVTAAVDAVSGSAVKMDIPLLENPQSITTIPREQLTQQAPLRLQEALRYTAGVQTETYGLDARGDWASFRGGEDWGQYLNGLRMIFGYNNYTRPEIYGLERIEVMRGPSSVLFGQSGFGGVLNLISKRPQPEHHREIELQLGNYRRRQAGLDLTGPITDSRRWLYRLVGVARDSNTQIDYVADDRLYLAPSLTWRPQRATSLTLLSSFQKDESGSTIGFFPWEGTLLPHPEGQIPTNTFISEPDFDEYNTRQVSLGYLFAHEAGDRWTIRQNANYSEGDSSYQSIYTAFNPRPIFEPDGRSVARNLYISKQRARTGVIDTQAETRLRTGAVSHTFLAGVDYQHAVNLERTAFDDAVPPIDVYAPQYGNFTIPPLSGLPEYDQTQTGLYAQDHINLTERLSTTLGVRKDWARSQSEGDPDSRNEDGAVTGRAGLVYATAGGLAPYLSFSQSFQPLTGTDIFNNPYEPTRARQVEAGAKFQPSGTRHLITASWFDIREQNRLTPDPDNPLNQIQVGEAHIRGAELETRARPFWNLDVILNYTYLDARISESNGDDEGARLPAVPKHFGSLWATKSFTIDGLAGAFSGGGAIRYNGPSFGGLDQTRTPSYTLFDLMFAYDRRDWRLAVNVSNLTDKVYLASCLSRGDCFYGLRRNVVATVGYRF